MDLLRVLQDQGIVDGQRFETISRLITHEGMEPEQALLQGGLSNDEARTVLSQYYDVPAYAFDKNTKIPYQVLSLIPQESAEHYSIVPLEIQDSILVVGVNDPDSLEIKEVLSFICSKLNVSYRLKFMLKSDVRAALDQYETLAGEVDEVLTSLQDDIDSAVDEQQGGLAEEDLSHIKEDAPVTKIVGTILRYAVDGNASDIHIEPSPERVSVRFRVDGSLVRSLELPKNTKSAIVARIKILASLRLDERRRPQDGRFSATFDRRKIDFRVSILPTNHGEKVVMRILDNARGVVSLEHTGIESHHLETIRRILNEPYGIILISGPTGSGKSTTLYTMLSEIDRETKNVLSLEDPIEYNTDGVAQSQVRPEIGYTFATGLRAALRQDPDIIMVGEIRDRETAQLAIQAALTGHLVLSTIHTNNSIGVVPRLVDMGVDPYLIAPTLKLAIAQRLAKRICKGTGIEKSVDQSTQMMIDAEFADLPERFSKRIPRGTTILHPESTPECSTGMRGRIAVMEALEITESIQELILRSGSEEEVYKEARKNGFMSMKEDAIIKALKHEIPFQEMTAFGTKVGLENVTDELAQDDNNHQDVNNYDEPDFQQV